MTCQNLFNNSWQHHVKRRYGNVTWGNMFMAIATTATQTILRHNGPLFLEPYPKHWFAMGSAAEDFTKGYILNCITDITKCNRQDRSWINAKAGHGHGFLNSQDFTMLMPTSQDLTSVMPTAALEFTVV